MKHPRKGLVLEINNNRVIVLTPDGQFLEQKITGKAPQIGSEINIKTYQTDWRKWSLVGIAAVLALIVIPLLALQLFIYPQMTVAYVTMDINPSIELGLNRYDKVISARGLNEDGILLLDNMELKNIPVDRAIEMVTEKAIKEKYISTDKENAIIISYASEKPVRNESPKINSNQESQLVKQEALENKVKQVIAENQQEAIVEIVEASPKVRSKANELGLSTGKYTLMLEAWDEGLEISLDSIKVNNIISVLQEKGVNPGQFINKIQQKNYGAEELENLTFKYEAKIKGLKKEKNEMIAQEKTDSDESEKQSEKETDGLKHDSQEGIKPENINKGQKDPNIMNGNNERKDKSDAVEKTNGEIVSGINTSKITENDNDNNEKPFENGTGQDNNLKDGSEDSKDPNDERPIGNGNKEKNKESDEENDKNAKDKGTDDDQNDKEVNKDDDNKPVNNPSGNKDSINNGKTKLSPEEIRKYRGIDLNELPENIRLMLLELLKKGNR